MESYRILSIEACDIYTDERKYGESTGYQLPFQGTSAYFWAFRNKLDASLDTIELKRVYESICKEPFAFSDDYGNEYTLAIVNVKFQYKPSEEPSVTTKALREHYYEKGFYINGIHHVRYKRSAGSSRGGNCLFIDERLREAMERWGECGLCATNDLASWEAYKSLSLSSIKGTVNIPIEGILFVPDYQSKFEKEVVSVELYDGSLTADVKTAEITNEIWDGESLLDESLFTEKYAEKHMLLLRNKFFKSCAFRTKLQKWIKDKSITLENLKECGFVTLAKDIRQIVMVTTPSSLKYLKFASGLSEENIRRWASYVDSTFGVVKWDKRTRFFGGRMVRGSYQLLNTIGLRKEQAQALMRDSIEYLRTIRSDVDFMRYHFSDVCAKEHDEEDEDEKDTADGILERAEVIFKLMNINNDFQRTTLYAKFRNDMVKSQKDNLLEGHILLNGTNATLFGNGPELLKYVAGEKPVSVLKPNQIRCGRFPNGQKLLCARSPHVTMGNLYCVENNLDGDIWNYFDLGENIVCVNAIEENIQQRLNGCDYDSDTMLITDNTLLIETAEEYQHLFKVPVCRIQSSGSANHTLTELDYNTSNSQIGQIVNLAQKLNSIIWDSLNKGNADIKDVYLDVCKLAVLSGLEIDKAKRAYDEVNTSGELYRVSSKYAALYPTFFKPIHEKNARGGKKKKEEREIEKLEKSGKYALYQTAMDYVYQCAKKIDFRDGKAKAAKYIPISSMLTFGQTEDPEDIKTKDKIKKKCENYKKTIRGLYLKLRKTGDTERDVLYEIIQQQKKERDATVAAMISNENVLYLLIKEAEKAKEPDWYFYAPLLKCDSFQRVLAASKERLATIVEDPLGQYFLYEFRYSKK